jgi:hypothetical protein
MNWLARLKNEKAPGTHATKATKPGFVGFVAYPHGPFQKTEAIAGACVTDAETGAKNQNAPSVDATKATKPGFVGFVAPTPWASQKIECEAQTRPTPSMREAHEVYLLHHWHCPTCCAAGQRYGQRCAEGARLWDAYNEAAQRERADRESTKQPAPAPEPPQPDPRLIASDYVPATEGELVRMLERVQHGEALGLSEREADELADLLHLRDREGDDRHLCIECQRVRASGVGWRCAALGPIPTDWVTRQLQRCPTFKGAEP